MKLNSIMTTAGVFCLMFAGAAKADCGLSSNVRNTASPEAMKASVFQTELLGARALPSAKSAQGNDPITGLWFTTFVSGGQTVDQGFDAWASDGLEILNDNPPPATGNVCLGTWVRTGPNDYKLYHPSWTFDNNGNANGMAIIRESITLSADRESFKGTYTLDIVTLAGAPVQHFSGSISATRITVN